MRGWPEIGLSCDASVFQINAIETEQPTPTERIDVNSGDLRSRGVEASTSYDLLRVWPVMPGSRHLTVFVNVSILNAEFTSSRIPGQAGKVSAYAPHYVLKRRLTMQGVRGLKLSLMVESVGAQYVQNSDAPLGTTPALIPAYTVADFTGQYSWGKHCRVEGGITSLGNHPYHSRVFRRDARAGADARVLRGRELPSLSDGLERWGRAGHAAPC